MRVWFRRSKLPLNRSTDFQIGVTPCLHRAAVQKFNAQIFVRRILTPIAPAKSLLTRPGEYPPFTRESGCRTNFSTMDQKLEGTPKATLRLEGRKVIRSEVTNNWGTRLQWKISRDGKEIATPVAGPELTFEPAEKAPGKYEIVLQQFQYVNYNKDKDGKFTASKYLDISEPVTFTI